MTNTRLLDHDPESGMTEFFHFDPETKGFVIETRQNVTALIEANTQAWNASDTHTRYRDGMHEVARLPNTIIMELAKQGIVTPAMRILDPKKFRAWLNSSENLRWRVRAGRV